MRPGFPAVEPAPALPGVPIEECVLMRLTEAREISDLRPVPDRGWAIEWPVAGRPD